MSEIPQRTITNPQAHPTKTMYDVSYFEVFWRNCIAGLARAFGSLLMYLIFILLLMNLFTTIVLPRLQPFIDSYTQALESLNSLNSLKLPSNNEGTSLETIDSNLILNNPEVQKLLQTIEQ